MDSFRLVLLGTTQLLHNATVTSSTDQSNPTDASPAPVIVEAPTHIGRRKAFALLAYLAMSTTPVRRATLAVLLWPGANQARAFSYLRRDLAVVKKLIGAEHILTVSNTVGLAHDDGFLLDVDQFRNLLSQCTTHGHNNDEVCERCLPILVEAAALYTGDFMRGFSLPDCPAFDEWQFFEAEQLRADSISMLSRLVHGWRNQGDLETALRYARQWLAAAPDDEYVHRELMRLYAMNGNQAAALRQYRVCVRTLAAELNVEPNAETHQLHEEIRTGQLPILPRTESGSVSDRQDRFVTASDNRRHEAEPEPAASTSQSDQTAHSQEQNIPRPSLPLIGREKELNDASQLLTSDPNCRLLTFVGPPGIGKSRLALETAALVQNEFRDGAYIVYLAPIRSADLIVQAIVDALPLQLQGRSDPRTQLLNYLRAKEILLLLDNYEHLLSKMDVHANRNENENEVLLLDILSAAPQIRLLVTSQVRMNLQQEWVREIAGLTFPSKEEMAQRQDHVALRLLGDEYSAVRLFIENARRIRADGVKTDEDLIAAVEVCQIVEGLPLGLELATSWLRFLSCADIATGIKRDLAFVDSMVQDIPVRHRSLNTLFEYSWRHLSEIERDALSKLSLFEGGFTHEAAGQAAGVPLRLLAALIDRSMVRSARSGRYDMHNILKQFSLRKLGEAGNMMQATQDAHCDYYTRFLQSRESGLRQIQRREIFAEVAQEADNIRSAWAWAVKNRRPRQIDASLDGLHYFYYGQGWVHEGETAFGHAVSALQPILAESDDIHLQLVFARLLSRQGRFAYRLGYYSEARENLRQSLDIMTGQSPESDSSAREERAFSLYYLSAAERALGNYAIAEQLCTQSLDVYREIGNKVGIASALKLLGIAAGSAGRYEEASALLNEALGLYRALDDRRGVANTLNDLGIVTDRQGLSADAKQLYEQCLSMRREINDAWGIATSLNNLGYLTSRGGNHAQAQQLLEESLLLHREFGDQYQIANTLSNLGSALLARGDIGGAENCFAEAIDKAWNAGAVPLIMECLTGMASALATLDLEAQARATEILHLVYRHNATDETMKAAAEAILSRLQPDQALDSHPEPTEQVLSSLVARIVNDPKRRTVL